MDFVKKHYEKILLGAVLLGLVGALLFMLYFIPSDRDRQSQISQGMVHPKVTPLPPQDLTRQTNVVNRLQSPYTLDFLTTNKVFNPVQWQKAPDGHLIKIASGNEVGVGALAVAKITPLCLLLSLDSVTTNEFGARFVISVERQAAPLPGQRGKRQHYASVGDKNEAFAVVGMSGSLDDPAQLKLNLQLTDTGEKATLTRDQPFRRVDGYAADLKYDPEGKKWTGLRVNADLRFYNDDYIIVAIDQDSVILLAKSNQKKTTKYCSP